MGVYVTNRSKSGDSKSNFLLVSITSDSLQCRAEKHTKNHYTTEQKQPLCVSSKFEVAESNAVLARHKFVIQVVKFVENTGFMDVCEKFKL